MKRRTRFVILRHYASRREYACKVERGVITGATPVDREEQSGRGFDRQLGRRIQVQRHLYDEVTQ
jgi:hypothetical protein